MKKLIVLLFTIFLATNLFGQDVTRGRLNIAEEDDSPSVVPYKLKVTNGTLVDNGDGTASLSIVGSETDPLSWSKATAQTGLTGNKTGSFNLNSTGNFTAAYYNGNGSLLTGLPTYTNESTTVSNSSTINLTKSTYDISADINSTLVSTWNGKQNALGYTPVNLAGDTMSGNLSIGGWNLFGDYYAAGNLKLHSTSSTLKGLITFGNSAYDETNNRLGIGTTTPAYALDVNGVINATGGNSTTWNTAYYPGGTDVAVGDGGTGKSSWTQYLIPYANTTTSFDQIAIGSATQVLTSNGAGAAPSFQNAGAASQTPWTSNIDGGGYNLTNVTRIDVTNIYGEVTGNVTGNAVTVTNGVYTSRYINSTVPLTGGGDLSADRTIAIPKATTSVDGYLNATDWTTFNNKAPTTSPTFVTPVLGTPTSGNLTNCNSTTQAAADNSTKLATTAYANALVADAINDATTGIAPSQNAVFDALALKSPLASPTFTTTINTPTIGLTGGQIAFPATAAPSANANTLDDYEEGTWTPGISFDGGTTGITYGRQVGFYTKIGNIVTVTMLIELSAKGTSTGSALITGLPFTVVNDFAAYSPVSLRVVNLSFANQYQANTDKNTTTIVLSEITEAGAYTALTNTEFTNATSIMVSCTYRAA